MRWMMTEDEILINLEHVTTIQVVRKQGLDEVLATIEATVMGRPGAYTVLRLPENASEDICTTAINDVRDNILYSNSAFIDYSPTGDSAECLDATLNSILAYERRMAFDRQAEALGL